MSTKFKVANVRLSFPSLFQHAVFGDSPTGKYEATFIRDKTKHADVIEKIKTEISRLMKEELKGKIPPDKICLKDGDESEREGYQGCYSIKASTKKRPFKWISACNRRSTGACYSTNDHCLAYARTHKSLLNS